MCNWLLFLFLLLIHGVFGAATDETEPVTVTEGDSISLHTNLSELLNDDTILWMFGPKDFLISQIKRKDDLTSFFVTDDERFRGRLQVDQKTGSLTIRNTRIRLSGQYKVTISREKTTIIKIFRLTVNGVVGETDGVKSVSISVTEGQSVTLAMDAEMHKDALMLWRFGDKGILLAKIDVETNEISLNNADERFRDRLQLNQTGSLTIKNTRTTDSGLYELQIRGSESSRRFLLSVIAVACEEKEEIVTEGDSPTLHTGLTEIHGNDVIEWCYEAEDNHIAEISGGTRKPSTLAGTDGRFRSKLTLDERTGDLTISNVRTIHSGLYKLKISRSSSSTIKIKHKRFILTVNVKSVSVKEGNPVLLQTGTEIQTDDIILWTFGPKNRLVVKSESGKMNIGKRFRDRLDLNQMTGSLTIRNIGTKDSGHFKLQIINSEQTTFRRFNVTVTDSTGEQVNGQPTVVTPLLNEEVTDGANEQQAASQV
ncbi:uncharacterized protein [Chanodichthys erythropterus]|uniref:uncharacterized protein isoform X3 n=1 Tax=Chanodichthys erythropterus TaxID=933992 RepID=UPI00351EE1F2